jgi:hypothetical protein
MTPILTDISDKSQIFFSQSPMHFELKNENQDATIQAVTVEVYIWRGLQTADLPTTPNLIYNNIKKRSPSDNYIAIEISSEVKAFITSSNLNKNNPQWAYNALSKPTTVGEGCYFHIVYKVDNESVKQLGTYFATIGYRYDFEQKGQGYTTFEDAEVFRKYAKGINYGRSFFNLDTVKETSSTRLMIDYVDINPSQREQQTGVKCLIAYVNRVGLWDTFTPFGKVTESIDTKRDEFNLNFRSPLTVNAQIQHLKQASAPKGFRKFTVNTGLIDEKNNYQIRELLQSSKVYLVIFENDVFLNTSVGITVDSTLITVDDTSIAVDSDNVTLANIGFYSKFVQIPVKNNTTNFLKKTKLNDKSSISYTLEFEGTNNFINDIM